MMEKERILAKIDEMVEWTTELFMKHCEID